LPLITLQMEHRVQIFRLNKRGKKGGELFFPSDRHSRTGHGIGDSGNSTCKGV